MFARYKKQRMNGKDDFELIEKDIHLFGCNEGFIPWLLSKQLSAAQGEPHPWHISMASALAKTEYPGSLVIDLKPKQKKTNLSLYEVLDVWGYSAAEGAERICLEADELPGGEIGNRDLGSADHSAGAITYYAHDAAGSYSCLG